QTTSKGRTKVEQRSDKVRSISEAGPKRVRSELLQLLDGPDTYAAETIIHAPIRNRPCRGYHTAIFCLEVHGDPGTLLQPLITGNAVNLIQRARGAGRGTPATS